MLLNRASLSLRLSTTCHSLLVSLFQQVLSVQLCPVVEVMNHAGYQQHCTLSNPLPAYQLLVLFSQVGDNFSLKRVFHHVCAIFSTCNKSTKLCPQTVTVGFLSPSG
uniref:(northern house mosquito) hypothetical protein n=1 Tax=Culex pipiens TaxID=7175 RepID=A0A8D8J534_CULPI